MAGVTGAGNAPPSLVQSRLSFTEGFLLGQISIVILLGVFIKFFIFGDPPSPETIAAKRALAYNKSNFRIINNNNSRHHRSSPSIDSPSSTPLKVRKNNQRSTSPSSSSSGLTTATILAKTYYNVNSHQPESLDWFNVLIAQTIAQFRNDAHHDDAILTSLTNILNGPQKPGFLSTIKVTEIGLGEDFPILSNCRVHPVDDDGENGQGGGRLQARMDVDLSDFITLGVETKIILNYPKPLTAVLPVALAVSVIRFSGTLSISFVPSSSDNPTTSTSTSTLPSSSSSPSSSNNTNNNNKNTTNPPSSSKPVSRTPTTLAFSFLPDYRLDLSVRSLVGSRSRLQDIPKIAQLVESRLHAWIDERCVEPRVQQVALPSLWPRKKNTRGPMGDGGDGSGSGGGGGGGGEGEGWGGDGWRGDGVGEGWRGGDGAGDKTKSEIQEARNTGGPVEDKNNNKNENANDKINENEKFLRWRGRGRGEGKAGVGGAGGGGAGGGEYQMSMPGGMPT